MTPLFNGRDLTGWVNVNCAPETWTVTNGVLYCTGTPTGELRTERMYQNFILELEWRHLRPQGNAGVFVWADALTARGQPFIRGIEVQVLDGREGAGFTSDGDIFPIHGATMKPVNGRGGDRAFPSEKRMKPAPEWNHYRIECVDGSVSLAVNGKVVTRGLEASPRKGHVCLESEGSPVEFRNIRLRELPVDNALEPVHIASPAANFVSLYTGTDLRGWNNSAGASPVWRSSDWILDAAATPAAAPARLWTEAVHGDFVLVVDWRWNGRPAAGATGAILLRGTGQVSIPIRADGAGSGKIAATASQAGTLAQPADRPVGEWNRFEITLRGNRVSTVLNGTTVTAEVRLPAVAASGPIGLEPGASAIQFANLFIKRLD